MTLDLVRHLPVTLLFHLINSIHLLELLLGLNEMVCVVCLAQSLNQWTEALSLREQRTRILGLCYSFTTLRVSAGSGWSYSSLFSVCNTLTPSRAIFTVVGGFAKFCIKAQLDSVGSASTLHCFLCFLHLIFFKQLPVLLLVDNFVPGTSVNRRESEELLCGM